MKRRTFLGSVSGAAGEGLAGADRWSRSASPRRPKAERHDFEVVVAGGGLAGVCAALASARSGARTAIVQDRPMFGGNSSSEVRIPPGGSALAIPWARETGIIEELLLTDRATNHSGLLAYGLMNSHYDLVLIDAVRTQKNLSAFLGTAVNAMDAAPVGKGALRISALRGFQSWSGKQLEFTAAQFIDCTGDATVGYLAGAEFRYGREARSEFGEPLAPIKADDAVLGTTLAIYAVDAGRPVLYDPPQWIHPYRDASDFGVGRLVRVGKGGFGSPYWLSISNPYHQVDDADAVREELLRHVLGMRNYIKNHSPWRAEMANYVPAWIGLVPGKRESRRLVGDVLVTELDCHQDRRWPDRVCYAGWHIDLHMRGNLLNRKAPPERIYEDERYRDWVFVPPFTLPLRAFYSRNVENLWMAGRNVSVTHVALGAVRVMVITAMMGQAVGTAAAYAALHGINPREAARPGGEAIRNIQQRLLRDGARVIGLRNEDPEDLALQAKASASSQARLDFGDPVPGEFDPLHKPLAQVFPVTTDRIQALWLFLRNTADQPAKVELELQELERIWDRGEGKAAARRELAVPPGSTGWFRVDLDARVNPGRPHRCSLRAHGAGGQLGWACSSVFPPGTSAQYLAQSPGGCEPKNRGVPGFEEWELSLPAYRHWVFMKLAYALRIDPVQMPYGPENVNNGIAWPEGMPNLWISDPGQPLPQSLELVFESPRQISTAILSFDTDLNLEVAGAPGLWRPPSCARHCRLYVREANAWRLVFEKKDNYQRRVVAEFPPVRTGAVKVEILSTNALPPGSRKERFPRKRSDGGQRDTKLYGYESPYAENTARLYEIRLYSGRPTQSGGKL